MKPLKQPKLKRKEAHSADAKYGMGDYYGTGIKAKVGRVRSDSMGSNAVTSKKLKTPPKSLA